MDILAAIDAAVGCQQCEGELTVSNDFCSPDCQHAWHAERAVPLPWAPDAALVYVDYDAARWRPETEGDLSSELSPAGTQLHLYARGVNVESSFDNYARTEIRYSHDWNQIPIPVRHDSEPGPESSYPRTEFREMTYDLSLGRAVIEGMSVGIRATSEGFIVLTGFWNGDAGALDAVLSDNSDGTFSGLPLHGGALVNELHQPAAAPPPRRDPAAHLPEDVRTALERRRNRNTGPGPRALDPRRTRR